MFSLEDTDDESSNSANDTNKSIGRNMLLLAEAAEKIASGEYTDGSNLDSKDSCKSHGQILRTMKAPEGFQEVAEKNSEQKRECMKRIAEGARMMGEAQLELSRVDAEFWSRLRVAFNIFSDESLHYNRQTQELEVVEDRGGPRGEDRLSAGLLEEVVGGLKTNL